MEKKTYIKPTTELWAVESQSPLMNVSGKISDNPIPPGGRVQSKEGDLGTESWPQSFSIWEE